MTAIQWTNQTWNPIVGCSRVSKGCEHCYAERVAHRGMAESHRGLTVLGKKGPRWTGEVRFLPDRLAGPLSWRKPRMVFVNSMSDLFHEGVSNEEIAAIFGVMAACPQHTFQVLTKRPERMLEWFRWVEKREQQGRAVFPYDEPSWRVGQMLAVTLRRLTGIDGQRPGTRATGWEDFDPRRRPWPLPNVDIGVSVEDQATADKRIPFLLMAREYVGGAIWVSYEPALGEVDFGLQSATCSCCDRWPSRWVRLHRPVGADLLPDGLPMSAAVAAAGIHRAESNRHGALSVRTARGLLGIKPSEFEALPGLDWIVIGGESGSGARPFDLAWARSTIAQCRAAGVPAFVKQLGALPVDSVEPTGNFRTNPETGKREYESTGERILLRDRKGGDIDEWPEDLRVREWPEARRA